VKNDANLVNARTGGTERLAHIGALFGKVIQPIAELHAGDIGGVAKLKESLTGDTLDDKGSLITFPKVQLPEPSIAYAVSAKTRNDEDRMGNAVHKILEEDLSLRFYRDPQTKEFLLAGTGQQHVEIITSRLKKRYSVDVELQRTQDSPIAKPFAARPKCRVATRNKPAATASLAIAGFA